MAFILAAFIVAVAVVVVYRIVATVVGEWCIDIAERKHSFKKGDKKREKRRLNGRSPAAAADSTKSFDAAIAEEIGER